MAEEPITHEQFMEALEDHFGVIPMENYEAIANAVQKFCPGLKIPSLKCPVCGKPMVVVDFDDFSEQLESYAESVPGEEGNLPEIVLNMACTNEECPGRATPQFPKGGELYLAVFRLVEVK